MNHIYGPNGYCVSRRGTEKDDFARSPKKLPAGAARIEPANPPTGNYSYSNNRSQGALVCQTKNFPTWYYPHRESFHCEYSDRLQSWDSDRFKKACEIAGGGDGAWAYRLPALSDDRLREFAKVALGLSCDPVHVRIVYYFNVSSGYSCPTVEAIYPKSKAPDAEANKEGAE